MIALYIFAGIGILVAILSLVVLVIKLLPTIIAEFICFKWSIQHTTELKKSAKINEKQKGAIIAIKEELQDNKEQPSIGEQQVQDDEDLL